MKTARRTKQRGAVLEAVRSGRLDHPTADEVYRRLRVSLPKISLGTVYRNLNFLVREGELAKIEMPNAPDRFDHNIFEHSHIICRKCGRAFDVLTRAKLAEICMNMEKEGFGVDSLCITARGICPQCAAAENISKLSETTKSKIGKRKIKK